MDNGEAFRVVKRTWLKAKQNPSSPVAYTRARWLVWVGSYPLPSSSSLFSVPSFPLFFIPPSTQFFVLPSFNPHLLIPSSLTVFFFLCPWIIFSSFPLNRNLIRDPPFCHLPTRMFMSEFVCMWVGGAAAMRIYHSLHTSLSAVLSQDGSDVLLGLNDTVTYPIFIHLSQYPSKYWWYWKYECCLFTFSFIHEFSLSRRTMLGIWYLRHCFLSLQGALTVLEERRR